MIQNEIEFRVLELCNDDYYDGVELWVAWACWTYGVNDLESFPSQSKEEALDGFVAFIYRHVNAGILETVRKDAVATPFYPSYLDVARLRAEIDRFQPESAYEPSYWFSSSEWFFRKRGTISIARWDHAELMEKASQEIISAIKNADLLTDYFGAWPDFSDAQIIALHFERGNSLEIFDSKAWDQLIPCSLRATFLIPAHIKAAAKVTLCFRDIARVAIDGFSYQNAIIRLAIRWQYFDLRKSNLFAVDWGGCGAEASLACEYIEVISLENMPA